MKFYSITETCCLIGIKRSTFYRLLNAGAITAIKIGHLTRISEEEIKDFIAKCPQLAPKKKMGDAQ